MCFLFAVFSDIPDQPDESFYIPHSFDILLRRGTFPDRNTSHIPSESQVFAAAQKSRYGNTPFLMWKKMELSRFSGHKVKLIL